MIPLMDIRPFQPDDAEAVVDLHERTIREICGDDYADDDIENWTDQAPRDLLDSAEPERHRFVVVEGDQVIGFGEYQAGDREMTGLYVRPDWIGEGVGHRLIEHIEKHAREEGLKQLTCYSTLTAESFYAAHGYERIDRAVYSGLEAVHMKKQLNESA